jgi:hypothetical protein
MHPPQVNDALQTEAAGAGDTGADVTTAGTSAASQASTASTTVPSPNVQPAAPVTASTNAMRVELAISNADPAEEVHPPVSVLQPAGTAAATKMDTEVGISPSCHHA